MKSQLLNRFAAALLAMTLPCVACAAGLGKLDDALGEWQIFGTNTLRAETYQSKGDVTSGPYPMEGHMGYDEINLNMMRRYSPYEVWRVQVYGVANGSDYRAAERGLTPERINLSIEKGDAAMPFRLEAGDYFANFSYRTLQRSLKGAQLELQPVTNGPWRHSFQFLSGINQPLWRAAQLQDDFTAGASWLAERSGTRLNLNLVNNYRQGDPAVGTFDRSQRVASVAVDHDLPLVGSHRVKFEGELAGLTGDHSGLTTPLTGLNRRGTGLFAQVSGRDSQSPLTYRFRTERYDRDYQPAGGVITPDRRSFEAHGGWRFDAGINLRARVQNFTDALQSGLPTDTRTYGFNLAGPLGYTVLPRLSGVVDVFQQDIVRRDLTVDRGIFNVNASGSHPLPDGWIGQGGVFWQDIRDRVVGAADIHVRQITFSGTHAWQLGRFVGSVTPGVAYRKVRGLAELDEWNPTIALALADGPHRISMSYGRLAQNFVLTATPDVTISTFGADYRYIRGASVFGAEFNLFDRAPTPGQFTTQYRASLFWQYNFERFPKSAQATRLALTSDAVGEGTALPRSPALLLSLAPGAALDKIMKRLEDSGFRGGVKLPGVAVYEAPLLDEVDQRQRVALVHEDGTLTKSALIVDFDNTGDQQSMAQLFERVRKALLDRFGNPVTAFEDGVFGPTLAADINAGRFIRTMEWQTESGRIRLGIPRRLDGFIRIEVQHAKNFPPPRDTLWSTEAVR